MIKIDRTELFRAFIMFEAFLVGIPIIVYWLARGTLFLLYALDLDACCNPFGIFSFIVLFFATFYFILPVLIASEMFTFSIFAGMPKDLSGWLVGIGTYSFLAFLLAFVLSLYTPLQKQKSRSPH